jgi:hypothetical protein
MAFQAFVADVKEGAALRLTDGEKILWDRRAPATRPRIASFKARVRRAAVSRGSAALPGVAIEATWDARCRGEVESEAVIQWSNDRGKTWYALGSMLRGQDAILAASSLPSGRIDLRLLVSDGFYTARSKTISVTLPSQPPMVSVMAPSPGGTVVAGRTMRLWGAVTVAGTSVDMEKVKATWSIDDKEVSEEIDAFVVAPRAGKHRARLTVAVQGRRTAVSVDFQSVRVPTAEEMEGGKIPPR